MVSDGKAVGSMHYAGLNAMKGTYLAIPRKYGVKEWFNHITSCSSFAHSAATLAPIIAKIGYAPKTDDPNLEETFWEMEQSLLMGFISTEINLMLSYVTNTDGSFDSIIRNSTIFVQHYYDKFAIADFIIHVEPICIEVMDMETADIHPLYMKCVKSACESEIVRRSYKKEYMLAESELLSELKHIMTFEITAQNKYNTAVGTLFADYVDESTLN